jgi:hypothetical protein
MKIRVQTDAEREALGLPEWLEFDWQSVTVRDSKDVKKLFGVAGRDLAGAMRTYDEDAILAFIWLAARKNGFHLDPETFDFTSFDIEPSERDAEGKEPAPPSTSTNTSSSNTSQPSDTSADSDPATSTP